MTAANHGAGRAAYAAWVPGAVATRIIVFGRGLVAEGAGFRLTRQSSERVEALVGYVGQNAAGFAARRGITAGRGRENYGGGLPENVLLPITRVAFLGARGHASLRGRHRMLVTWDHRLRALPQIPG
jgi:hypothetical protein